MDADDGSHRVEGTVRYPCSVDSCLRSFLRKEHLTRHQRTHNPESSHICPVCSKKFNRSDSLLRHLSLHDESFKSSFGRSKQACITCHAAKIKCDGNKRCSACVKKGVRCRYRLLEDYDQAPGDPENITPPADEGFSGAPSSSNSGNDFILTPTNLVQTNIPSSPGPPMLAHITDHPSDNVSPGSQALPLSLPLGLPTPRSDGFIDWSTIRIQSDSSRRQENTPREPLNNTPAAEKYLDLYFTHFHHRWPVVHRGSYNDSNKGPLLGTLTSSMIMIGAWFEGSRESRKYAIALHHEAIAECFLGLSKITSHDIFQQSLPAALCQASLINVIFVLYCGTEEFLSRGIILRNMLVAVIREVGFSIPETIWADEKPGYFLLMHLMKKGERQKFSEILFKIDSYLNLLRGQPPMLMTEELVFQLPSSFSSWNSDGLHIWETRLGSLPLYRSEKSVAQMITDHTTEPFKTPDPSFLWEDLQLCLCAMQSRLWQLHTRRQNPNESQTSITSQKEVIERTLQFLKQQYDQMASTNAEPNLHDHPLLSHYYGFEDHSNPTWKPTVTTRVQGLESDTLHLYHFVSLHLYADISLFTHVASEYSTRQENMTEPQRIEIGKRRCMTASWVSGRNARRALCHATELLIAYQNINNISGLTKETLDPIAHIALATAALIVWVNCSFGLYSCDNFFPSMGLKADKMIPVVELVTSSQSIAAREAWMKEGGSYRVEIDGMKLCVCSAKDLLARFKAYLPVGWELVDTIAPGVFEPA